MTNMDTNMKHNYQKKIARLIAEGKLNTNIGVHMLNIQHDDWCAIFDGGLCNCDPDIELAEPVWDKNGQYAGTVITGRSD